METQKKLEDLVATNGISLIKEVTPSLMQCLDFLKYASPAEAEKIVSGNVNNLLRFLDHDKSAPLKVYFEVPGKAIGAIKFNNESITTRQKKEDGLHSIDVPPYLEIGSIAVIPEFRGQGLSKRFYNSFLEIFNKTDSEKLSPYLLIGAVGNLEQFYNELYANSVYKKNSPFIPKEVFGKNWDLVEKARPESRGTEVCCNQLGIPIVGSSRSSGGPIFLSELNKIYFNHI